MNTIDLLDLSIYEGLTRDLRLFNEKICVVEISIRLCNESEEVEVKTRKIQSNSFGIQLKSGASMKSTSTSGMTTHANAALYQICTSLFLCFTSPLNAMSPRLANPTTPSTSIKQFNLENSRNSANSAKLLEKCKAVLTATPSSTLNAWPNTANSAPGDWDRSKILLSSELDQNPTVDTNSHVIFVCAIVH